jgi:release factor glutamine methyltransferase
LQQEEPVRPLTVEQLVVLCARAIGGADSDREAREIVAAVLNVGRSWPSTHGSDIIDEETKSDALFASRMRATGMPLQYAVGKAAFRHLILSVDRRVLIPRPETEMLVDLVLKAAPGGRVADIGTGSGAIAISLATEGSYDCVIATDVSAASLEVARENAEAYRAQMRGLLEFREGSLLEPLAGGKVDAIVSNPPYIAEAEMQLLPPEVREWEPHPALVSGRDGLDATRDIVAGAAANLNEGGLLALEVDTRRADRAADILRAEGNYEKIEITADLTGRARFVSGVRR